MNPSECFCSGKTFGRISHTVWFKKKMFLENFWEAFGWEDSRNRLWKRPDQEREVDAQNARWLKRKMEERRNFAEI